MSKEKIYNHNVKTATNSELEPVELFFVKKFNESRESGIDFLSNGNNTVSVLYFNDANSCVSYDCFCTQEEKTADGKTNFLFRFTVNKYKEYNIDEGAEGMELSDKCVFLLPPSGVVMAEPIKKYIDNAAPEDKESLKNKLEKLVDAAEGTPIDKVCAKLVLENKAVKFVHSTLPKNNQEWLKTNQAYYFLEGVLLNAAINIKNIGGENDANESENSESQNNTIHQLRKKWNLTIEKGKQIEPQSQIIEKKYCTGTTWEKLLAVAGIDDDTFKLRLFPDAFARVYILLGKNGENNPLKPVAYIHTSWQEIKGTRIKVVRINLINTGSDKAVSSGATPARDADKTKVAKAIGDVADNSTRAIVNGNIESDFSKLDLRRAGSSITTKVNVMVRLYPAITWFVIVVREFIDRCYKEIPKNDDPLKMMISHFEGKIQYKECIDRRAQLQAENKTYREIDKILYDNYPYYSVVKSWSTKKYRVESNQESLYDINNCNVFFDIVGDFAKLNDADRGKLANLSKLAKETTKTRNCIAHYDLNTIDPETDIECEIKKIKDFIEYLNGFDLCRGQFDLHMSEVEKLLVQPVSIKFCPKCGEELPGGEYTFRPEPKG